MKTPTSSPPKSLRKEKQVSIADIQDYESPTKEEIRAYKEKRKNQETPA